MVREIKQQQRVEGEKEAELEARRKQEALEAEARAVKAKQDEAKLEKIK